MSKPHRNSFVRTLTAFLFLGITAIGCGSEGTDSIDHGKATTEQQTANTSTAQEALVVDIDENTSAQGTTQSNGHFIIRISRKDGAPQLEADYSPPADGKVAIEYTFHPPATGDNPSPSVETSKIDLDLGEDEKPTLSDAINGTVFLHSQLNNATLNEYDNYGCDLPGKFHDIGSCGPKGKCCDIHDACYKKYHCTSGSWKSRPWSKCQVFCNYPAVSCFTSPIPVGRSSCCSQGNCGKPRP